MCMLGASGGLVCFTQGCVLLSVSELIPTVHCDSLGGPISSISRTAVFWLHVGTVHARSLDPPVLCEVEFSFEQYEQNNIMKRLPKQLYEQFFKQLSNQFSK